MGFPNICLWCLPWLVVLLEGRMLDFEIDKTLKELGEILAPKALVKLCSHIYSLTRQIEDLRASRDNWRNKYEQEKQKK